jgi:hypothetical protein
MARRFKSSFLFCLLVLPWALSQSTWVALDLRDLFDCKYESFYKEGRPSWTYEVVAVTNQTFSERGQYKLNGVGSLRIMAIPNNLFLLENDQPSGNQR